MNDFYCFESTEKLNILKTTNKYRNTCDQKHFKTLIKTSQAKERAGYISAFIKTPNRNILNGFDF